jgi:hypothetical protein
MKSNPGWNAEDVLIQKYGLFLVTPPAHGFGPADGGLN